MNVCYAVFALLNTMCLMPAITLALGFSPENVVITTRVKLWLCTVQIRCNFTFAYEQFTWTLV